MEFALECAAVGIERKLIGVSALFCPKWGSSERIPIEWRRPRNKESAASFDCRVSNHHFTRSYSPWSRSAEWDLCNQQQILTCPTLFDRECGEERTLNTRHRLWWATVPNYQSIYTITRGSFIVVCPFDSFLIRHPGLISGTHHVIALIVPICICAGNWTTSELVIASSITIIWSGLIKSILSQWGGVRFQIFLLPLPVQFLFVLCVYNWKIMLFTSSYELTAIFLRKKGDEWRTYHCLYIYTLYSFIRRISILCHPFHNIESIGMILLDQWDIVLMR